MQLLRRASVGNTQTLRLKLHPVSYREMEEAAAEAGVPLEEAAEQLLVQALKLLRLHKRREGRKEHP